MNRNYSKRVQCALWKRDLCFLRFPRAQKQLEAGGFSKLSDTTMELLGNSSLVSKSKGFRKFLEAITMKLLRLLPNFVH